MVFKLNPDKIDVKVKVLCVGEYGRHSIEKFSPTDFKFLNRFDFELLPVTDKDITITNFISDSDIFVIISRIMKDEVEIVEKVFEQLSSIVIRPVFFISPSGQNFEINKRNIFDRYNFPVCYMKLNESVSDFNGKKSFIVQETLAYLRAINEFLTMDGLLTVDINDLRSCFFEKTDQIDAMLFECSNDQYTEMLNNIPLEIDKLPWDDNSIQSAYSILMSDESLSLGYFDMASLSVRQIIDSNATNVMGLTINNESKNKVMFFLLLTVARQTPAGQPQRL